MDYYKLCKTCDENKLLIKFAVHKRTKLDGNVVHYYDKICRKCRTKDYKKKMGYLSNPTYIYSALKCRCGSRKNKVSVEISRDDFVEWYNKQEQRCYYCQRTLQEYLESGDSLNRNFKKLSIDRLDNNKGYKLGNIVISCMRCNFIKGDYFTEKEMLKIGEIVKSAKNGKFFKEVEVKILNNGNILPE